MPERARVPACLCMCVHPPTFIYLQSYTTLLLTLMVNTSLHGVLLDFVDALSSEACMQVSPTIFILGPVGAGKSEVRDRHTIPPHTSKHLTSYVPP